ncbi:TRAP transporter small permease [Marinomonas sp. M1K-6]|uniref:TRAP transporter small permease protein n=1 Tax=Marinomonas profundi TaxID=2726122 RepID=A0A847R823_9GAMM|nr:TRAP transporter small permease [Marinomonas profundi]NLQ17307.1 TRAP transporter small permease [Marinomonas profundi]UDV01836.1 TRAP transporter small permease [Marinomonas profundi]
MLSVIRKLADGLIALSAAIGALGLIVEVIILLADVIGRAFGAPIYGSQDMITMTMVIVVFGAMALCDREGGHISVDLFERSYPALLNRLIDIFSAVLGAVIFVGIAYAVNESAKLSVMLNLSTNLLRLPKAWFQNGLSIFALLTAAGMALRAIELTLSGRDIRKGDTAKGDTA